MALSVFSLPEVRTIVIAVISAGLVNMASNYATARESDAVVIERLTTQGNRIGELEEVTKSIAAAQASQAASAASVAATQQAMARVLERTDQDIRDIREKMEKKR